MISTARSSNSAACRERLGMSLSPASSCRRHHDQQKQQVAPLLAECADTSLRPHASHFQVRAS
eukprot:15337061-Alexandrium_andersonii.AAC.1